MTPIEQRDKLIKLKNEYIDLMVKEANRSFGIAYAHGYIIYHVLIGLKDHYKIDRNPESWRPSD